MSHQLSRRTHASGDRALRKGAGVHVRRAERHSVMFGVRLTRSIQHPSDVAQRRSRLSPLRAGAGLLFAGQPPTRISPRHVQRELAAHWAAFCSGLEPERPSQPTASIGSRSSKRSADQSTRRPGSRNVGKHVDPAETDHRRPRRHHSRNVQSKPAVGKRRPVHTDVR